MFNTTAEFKEEIKKPSRSFECRITIGDLIFTNEDIVDIKLDGNIQPQEGFIIGATTSTTLDLVLLNSEDHIYSTNQIKVEIGLKIGSKIEYILMGYYNIDDIEKTHYTTKFTAYDNMIKFETPYFSKLGNTATLQQIVNELATITGVEFTGSLPAYNLKKLEGFTCREILSFVASICGGNALITREGKFTIVVPKEIDYSLTTDNYFEYKKEEVPYKVGKVSCQVGEEILSKGSLGTDSMELEFENPWINETILNDIYNKLKGFSYLGYTMKWQGDISLDVGDIITCKDTKGVVRKLPILSQNFTYTGGLTSEISAQGESKNKNSFSSNGNMNNKVNRVVTELLIVNEALINKANIQDLQATNAEIQNLKASNAEIENALIKFATIEQLNATNANIQNLIAEDARINQAIINKADITELNALDGKITNLQSEVGKIGVLESNVANIKDLINGNLSSENIQTEGITGDRLNMSTIFVTDANILNVNASKMNTGELNTTKVKIKSEDGGIEIVGATQQFKDKNNKVRIQMGKDTKGNFNFILRGEDGTTALIDHTGIKKAAIADNLIVENMIAANAVGEKAIDYNSFSTGFNKDTNTSTIKGTKVRLDNQNQTLEVAFTSLKNQSDNTKSTVESHTTELSVQQGKISTLIADTTITKDGQIVKLKDDYNSTVVTVNSMKNTINSHTTKIDANTGKITGVESKTNVLERDLNSMSSKLTSTEQTVSNHTTQINSVQSIANTANSKIDNLQIGTENIILNSDFSKGSKHWNNGGFNIIEENGEKVATVSRSGLTSNGYVSCYSSRAPYNPGELYTFSLDFKVKDFNLWDYKAPFICETYDLAGARIDWKDVSLSTIGLTSLENEKWYRLNYTWSSENKDSKVIGIRLCLFKNGEVFYKKIKVSKGNKPILDWSKSSKDIDEDIININTEITTTKNKVSTIEQNMDSITQRVGSVETITTSHTASLNAVDGKINTAKTQALNDAKAFTTSEISKVNTTMNSKFAEIKTTTDAINLEVNNTKKEVEKVNVKVDNVQIGGRNLLRETEFKNTLNSKFYSTRGSSYQISVDNTTLDGHKSLKILGTAIGTDGNDVQIYSTKEATKGMKFKLSFYAKATKAMSLTARWGHATATSKNTVNITTDWRKYEIDLQTENMGLSWQYFYIILSEIGTVWIVKPKLEIGTKATDYTNAPEDTSQEILDVTTTKINDAKAEIKLTTDAIKQSVSSVESKTTTINNNLNNTNSEVNTLKSKTTTLETNLSGITGRVTNVESSTASLNGEMTSIKSRVQTAEQKLTATSIINSVNEALSNGSNIKGMATELTKAYFRVKNTNNSARIDLSNGNISTYSPSGRNCLDIIEQNIQFYDFEKGTDKVGAIASLKNSSGKWDIGVFSKLAGQRVSLGFENSTGTITTKLVIDKGSGISLNDTIDALGENLKIGFINQDNRSRNINVCNLQMHANCLNVLPDGGWLRLNMWQGDKVVINAGNGNSENYGVCRARSWETVNKSIQLANTKDIGSYYTSSTEDSISDIGHGIIGENGETIILFEDEFLSFADTNTAYFISYEIVGRNRNPVYTVEHNSNYFIVGGEPGQEFSYRIECKKLGDNCRRYYREFESNTEVINEGLDNTEGIIIDNKEEQKRAGLIDYLKDMSGMQQLKVNENIEELNENNRAMQMLSVLERVKSESEV